MVSQIKNVLRYWANLPEDGPERKLTTQDRCDGVAFSILSMLDGCTDALPAVDLVLRPHEEDKAYHRSNGERRIEPETVISDILHELYCGK